MSRAAAAVGGRLDPRHLRVGPGGRRTPPRTVDPRPARARPRLPRSRDARRAARLLGDWLDDFGSSEIVKADPIASLPAARAAGVRAASAEIVAFVEDHAFPADGWAEALLDAHNAGHAGVGAVMVNLNPRSSVSWTDLFLSYGAFVEGSQAGIVTSIPHDNSSYKRSALLELEPALEALLGDQAALQRELRERGHELYLEARARLLHLNFSRLSSWLRLRFLGGRAYAGERAERERWSRVRRLVWAGLALPGTARRDRALRPRCARERAPRERPRTATADPGARPSRRRRRQGGRLRARAGRGAPSGDGTLLRSAHPHARRGAVARRSSTIPLALARRGGGVAVHARIRPFGLLLVLLAGGSRSAGR